MDVVGLGDQLDGSLVTLWQMLPHGLERTNPLSVLIGWDKELRSDSRRPGAVDSYQPVAGSPNAAFAEPGIGCMGRIEAVELDAQTDTEIVAAGDLLDALGAATVDDVVLKQLD